MAAAVPRRLALPLALALLSILPACRTVPADVSLAESGSEPARTGVFVEAQPNPREARSGTFAPISAEIANLYRCWFRDPYSYMFSGAEPQLEVNGNRYGMLMAGIGGILWYGNLNNCAGELTGRAPSSYSDIGPIEALAGVPATLPGSRFDFATVNPEFIAYARHNLLPPPDQTIDGIPPQLAYDLVFQRFFRVMGLTLVMLLEHHDIDAETQQYLSATSAGADGIEWLEGQYARFIDGATEPWDGTTMTAAMAVGFWLRRHADGSLAACWYGLRDVLVRYDRAWYDEIMMNGKAKAKLELLPDPLGSQR